MKFELAESIEYIRKIYCKISKISRLFYFELNTLLIYNIIVVDSFVISSISAEENIIFQILADIFNSVKLS